MILIALQAQTKKRIPMLMIAIMMKKSLLEAEDMQVCLFLIPVFISLPHNPNL